MKIKKQTITKEKYTVTCQRCGKDVTGVSEKQVLHNFDMHQVFCKRKEETQ